MCEKQKCEVEILKRKKGNPTKIKVFDNEYAIIPKTYRNGHINKLDKKK